MSDTDLDDIKARVTARDVLELLEMDVPDGEKAHCPHHEDPNPSLHLYRDPERGWYAFCCGAGGDVFDLVRFITGCSTSKAIAFLAGVSDDFDVVVQHQRTEARELRDFGWQFETDCRMGREHPGAEEAARAYVYDKWPHLGLVQLRDWGIGYGPYNLLIPHYDDYDGAIVGVKARAHTGGQKGRRSAYPGSCFTSRLYRVEETFAPRPKVAVLCEGESDTWTATVAVGRSGVNVFGLPSGVNTIKPEFIDELVTYDRVIVALDADDAGRRGAATVCETLRQRHTPARDWVPPVGGDVTEAVLASVDLSREWL